MTTTSAAKQRGIQVTMPAGAQAASADSAQRGAGAPAPARRPPSSSRSSSSSSSSSGGKAREKAQSPPPKEIREGGGRRDGRGRGRGRGWGRGQSGRSPIKRSRAYSAADDSKHWWQESQRKDTVCWFGRDCTRAKCWFSHPDGRKMDEQENRHWHQAPRRSRSPPAKRFRSRSPERWCHRARSASRPARAPSSPRSNSRSQRRSVSSSTSGSKSPARNSPDAAAPAAPPANSFRDFVLRELDDSVNPEEALAKFKKHQELQVEVSLGKLKGTGLFSDLYHPLSVLRSFDLRVSTSQMNAREFLKGVEGGLYGELCLRAADAGHNKSCPTSGHAQPPHFAFDPDVDTLLISAIPPKATFWDIYDSLKSCAGFVACSVSRPSEGSLTREVRARFASAGHVRTAFSSLADGMPQGCTMRPALIDPSPELKALAMPPEMSHPDRVAKDVSVSAQVIRRLDGFMGIGAGAADAVLGGAGTSPERRLDLQVLYLRRVHHFCFYAARWCTDEWDLREHCGAGILRGGSGGSDAGAPPEAGEWAAAHDQRLERFLETAKVEPPRVPSWDSGDGAAAEAVCDTNTLRIAEGKYQCVLCSKKFRGPEYVRKHLWKVHADHFEAVQQAKHEVEACAAYMADANRPVMP